MKTEILILQHVFSDYLFHRHLLEKCNAENLEDFAQTQFHLEFFLDYCHKNVNADGNPYLGLHCVLADAEKSLYSIIAVVSANASIESFLGRESISCEKRIRPVCIGHPLQ